MFKVIPKEVKAYARNCCINQSRFDLGVLHAGVLEGRRTFGKIPKENVVLKQIVIEVTQGVQTEGFSNPLCLN